MRLAIASLAAFALAAPLLADAPRKRALLVGVSTYRKAGFADRPLPFAAGDMEALDATLRQAGWDVTLLTSKGTTNGASRAHIVAALERLLDGVEAEDLVLVALSGHGQQFRAFVETEDNVRQQQEEAFFCPSDAVPGEAGTLIGMTELTRVLGRKGGRNLVLVDCCRDDPRKGGVRGFDGNSARHVPSNTALLFSCAATQQSYETNKMYPDDPTRGHGVFFHRVWKGLLGDARNERGDVTWARLTEYVCEHVNEDAVAWFPDRVQLTAGGSKIVQTPHLVGNLTGKSPVLATAAGTRPADPRTRPALDLSGEWVIDDGSTTYAAKLTQSGDRITGTYALMGGTVEGKIENGTLVLTWDQPGNQRGGRTRLQPSDGGTSLEGPWDYDPTRYTSGLTGEGRWTWRRAGER